jgi:uncharacterized protein (UPF0147 family)
MADENTEAPADGAEVEQQARQMGWMPKEDWKGNPNSWVDAGEFVKRGETFIPFLQHDRKKLKSELEAERQSRLAVEQQLKEVRESVEGLKSFNEEMAQERQARRKVELAQELKQAREDGNEVRAAELTAELGEIVKKPNGAAPAPAPAPKQPDQPVIQPWVKQFIDGNSEFFQSGRKVALFNAVMLERRQAGDMRVGPEDGTALLNEVREEVDRALGGNPRRQAAARTEESRPAGGRSRASGQGYADLPPEAQEKCNQQEERFVGKGKAFKDQAAWRKHYAKEYFGPSAVTRMAGE